MTDKIRTCYFCGHEGVLGDDIQDTTYLHLGYVWACENISACIDRQIEKGIKPSYYRKTEEIRKQEAIFNMGIKDSWQGNTGR